MTAALLRQVPRGTAPAGVSAADIRDVLGRAHYTRMAEGMAAVLALPVWEDLPEGTREVHRSRLDWLLPAVLGLIRGTR